MVTTEPKVTSKVYTFYGTFKNCLKTVFVLCLCALYVFDRPILANKVF